MSEPNGNDWNEMGRRWRSGSPSMPTAREIRARMQAKRRRIKAAWAGDVTVAGLLVVYIAQQLVRHPNPATWLWATAFAVCLVTAFVFVGINRRGLWPPPTDTLTAYVAHARRHCRSRRRSIRFAWGLYAAELAFMLGFFFWVGLAAEEWVVVGGILAAFTLGLALWTTWFGRRIRAEQRYLESLSNHELTGDGSDL